jgi:hypothetical protein
MRKLLAIVSLAVAAGAHSAAGPVDVRSGGVTLESREAMMKAATGYNLRLAFVQADGSFLANVEVAIHDARGAPVWTGIAEGPLLFARVPPGGYAVTATAEGRTLKRTLKAGGGALEYLRWPAR